MNIALISHSKTGNLRTGYFNNKRGVIAVCHSIRPQHTYRVLATIILVFNTTDIYAADDVSDHWWSGFSITPGVGARHLGLDVTRKSDGAEANISQAGTAQLFASLNVSTPLYKFDDSNWGFAVRMYSSFTTLDNQWYDYHTTDPSSNTAQGERVDVGTSISGYYSYIIPTLAYSNAGMGAGIGIGLLNAKFNGDIILTHDKNPVQGMPKDDISFSTFDTLAYIVTLNYATTNDWLYEMTVGGTTSTFGDSNYKYQLEEISMTVGKKFTF